jgi:hypothetical protein
VKRWERSMLAAPADAPAPGSARSHLDRLFDIPGLSALCGRSLLAQGLYGPVPTQDSAPAPPPPGRGWLPRGLELAALDAALEQLADDARSPAQRAVTPGRTQFVIDERDPDRAQRRTQALVAEQRLNMDLRAAGLKGQRRSSLTSPWWLHTWTLVLGYFFTHSLPREPHCNAHYSESAIESRFHLDAPSWPILSRPPFPGPILCTSRMCSEKCRRVEFMGTM